MSKKIAYVLDILEVVRLRYGSGVAIPVKKLRREAEKDVADHRERGVRTIADKYLRQLDPPVKKTADFDQLAESWLKEGSDELRLVLLRHSSDSRDRQRVERFFTSAHAPSTPKADDIEEGIPTRVKQETYRILRDTARAREVKAAHSYRCQLCGGCLTLSDGTPYAEAHHVKPLANRHRGPDIDENIICVCPNCHVLLDYGVIQLDSTRLEGIDGKFITYHNARIYRRPSGSA